MGYHVDGDITVVAGPDANTVLALARDAFPGGNLAPGGDLVHEALLQAGLDIWDVRDEDDTTSYHCSIHDSWRMQAEEILAFLAAHHLDVTGQLRGEDDEAWAYRTDRDRGVLITDQLDTVPAEQVEAGRQAVAALQAARKHLGPETVDRVRALLAVDEQALAAFNHAYDALTIPAS